jgi:hypothetical protein
MFKYISYCLLCINTIFKVANLVVRLAPKVGKVAAGSLNRGSVRHVPTALATVVQAKSRRNYWVYYLAYLMQGLL